MQYIIILFVCIIIYKIIDLKIHIDFKTFLKKGFKKKDNKFRSFLLLSVNKAREKHLVVLSF